MVSRNTTLIPSLGLRIVPACEAGLSAGMRRERVPPRIRKKEKDRVMITKRVILYLLLVCWWISQIDVSFGTSAVATTLSRTKVMQSMTFAEHIMTIS